MQEQTIIIWDSCGESSIKFIVLDGNFYKFKDIYINSYHDDTYKRQLASELCDLIYDEDGNPKVEFLDDFPAPVLIRNLNAFVIIAGELP